MADEYVTREKVMALEWLVERLLDAHFEQSPDPLTAAREFRRKAEEAHVGVTELYRETGQEEYATMVAARATEVDIILEGAEFGLSEEQD